jgi:hypothetical protein
LSRPCEQRDRRVKAKATRGLQNQQMSTGEIANWSRAAA